MDQVRCELTALCFGVAAVESIKSGAEQIHALIRSSDNAQNEELWVWIETRLPFQIFRGLCLWAFPTIVLANRMLRARVIPL
jgi:hypothetical protein